jgi:hypothetical protein
MRFSWMTVVLLGSVLLGGDRVAAQRAPRTTLPTPPIGNVARPFFGFLPDTTTWTHLALLGARWESGDPVPLEAIPDARMRGLVRYTARFQYDRTLCEVTAFTPVEYVGWRQQATWRRYHATAALIRRSWGASAPANPFAWQVHPDAPGVERPEGPDAALAWGVPASGEHPASRLILQHYATPGGGSYVAITYRRAVPCVLTADPPPPVARRFGVD